MHDDDAGHSPALSGVAALSGDRSIRGAPSKTPYGEGQRQRSWRLLGVAVEGIVLFVFTFTMFLGAREVWTRPLPSLSGSQFLLYDYPPLPPKPPAQVSLPTLVVYFPNGSHLLSGPRSEMLEQFASSVAACGDGIVELTGWVSSAPFAQKDEELNFQLAANRTAAVRKVLEVKVPQGSIAVHLWKNLAEIRNDAYLDSRQDPRTANPVEDLNRRVDVVLKSGRCVKAS